MPYSIAQTLGNGASTNFVFSFPYLDQAHIFVTVDGVPVAYTWIGAGTVQVLPAPANLSVVKITRNTSQAVRLVDFQDGTVLTELSLDTANLQAFYMAQEAFDASAAVLNSTELTNAVNSAAASAAAAAASALLAGGYASAALGFLNSSLKTNDRFEIQAAHDGATRLGLTAEGYGPELVLTDPFNAVGHRKWKIGVFGDVLNFGPDSDLEDTFVPNGITMARGLNNALTNIELRATTLTFTGPPTFNSNLFVPSGLTANAIPNASIVNSAGAGTDTYLGIIPSGTVVASPRLILADRNHADHVQFKVSIETGNYAEISTQAVGAGTALPLRFVVSAFERMRFHAAANRQTFGGATDDGVNALQFMGAATFDSNLNFSGVGKRFTADFSNATPASRMMFQTNTVNGFTAPAFLPNGTGNLAALSFYNNSDPTAPLAFCDMRMTNTRAQITSSQLNAGTALPLFFAVGGGDRMSIDILGNVAHKNAIADQSYSLQVPITGFAITVGNNISTLLLNPAGTLATGTITMPATPVDGQIVRLATTQTVTALTLNANAGQTISGNVATLTAAAPATYMYNLSGTKWYHIQ